MGQRILVVEDDLLNQMLYQAVLEAEGYTVRLVDDGSVAIKEVREFVPDLITMDIQLPNVSGHELIRKLQSDPALKPIPIIAITAFVGAREEARVRQAGASGFIAKPVSIGQLVGEIRSLLPKMSPKDQRQDAS